MDYLKYLLLIKEDILFNEKNNPIKLSSEIIQKIELKNINERFTKNRIINIKLNNISFKKKFDDYENDYIVQSVWNILNVYIKKNNNRYYFYKEIKTLSRIYSLFSFESKNLFFAQDFFSNTIYIFSSETLELITIIKGIEGNRININTFGKLNKKIVVFLGLNSIYLYNINI